MLAIVGLDIPTKMGVPSSQRLLFGRVVACLLLSLALLSANLWINSISQRALTGTSKVTKPPRYDPQQVLARYKEQHSVDQLKRECPRISQDHVHLDKHCPQIQQRRFAVAFYSCPHQAGNRLHHFMNNMAWAIATNRTLLWKYYDDKTCRAVGQHYAKSICYKTGTKEQCDEILHLAEWIPSFDEWFPLLHLGSGAEAPYYSTHYPPTTTNEKHPFYKDDVKHAGIDKSDIRLLNFGQLLGQDFRSLHTKKTREYLLHTNEARMTAHELLGEGEILQAGDYLYGMLFHAAFSLSESLLSAVNSNVAATLPYSDETTIALHSRHSQVKDDGSQVNQEVQCLQHMLRDVQGPCRVFVMSDRPKAVHGISTAVAEMNCTVTTFQHKQDNSNTINSSFSKEHGPFAGAGFFLDLALASKARHGLVGTRRSSTMLLAELIAFQNGMNGDYRFCNYEKKCSCTTVMGE